ncbi:membrane protein insertion efficiency factor YidD [uncultured Aquimarina sp.]|uniref:membrane protein insertion efficiency factor YidD n=1 Tax=uncultured Aquimarina sp. TaxID=575652 RepID=UPI00262F17D4|nr:membrane protein insertion efficiency factor YidD [uncultured Aquimarina sp.]
MKNLLLVIIRSYWILIPMSKRKKCVFKKSCSHYVYDITKQKGLFQGIRALKFRFQHCRSGYHILEMNKTKLFISANHKVFNQEEIKDRIFNN